MKYEGGKFCLAELGISNALKKITDIKTNAEGVELLDMQDFDNKQSIIDACDVVVSVGKSLSQLAYLVYQAKLRLLNISKTFASEYNRRLMLNPFEFNNMLLNEKMFINSGLIKYDDDDLKKYIDDYLNNNPELIGTIEDYENRETFKKYLDHYENPWLYNYMYGNGSYEAAKKYITEDKKYFISYSDGCGRDDKNFAFGILHYLDGTYYNVENYKKVGIDIKNGSYDKNGESLIPVDKVLEVQDLIIDENIKKVKNNIGEDNYNNLTSEQQYCLVDIAYHGCTTESWNSLKGMLDNGYSSKEIADNWGRLSSTSYNNESRKNARRELWLNGNYTDANGDIISY